MDFFGGPGVRLCTSNAGGTITGWGMKIPHVWCDQKKVPNKIIRTILIYNNIYRTNVRVIGISKKEEKDSRKLLEEIDADICHI